MTNLDEHDLTLLLERDASSVEPKRVPLSTIVDRSRRAKHRRRSVAAATGLAATVGLGAVAVRVWPESAGDGEVQAASSAETTDPTDGAPVEGPPLRMGLVVEGATVTGALDATGGPAAHPVDDINMRWTNPAGDRTLFVLAGSRSEGSGSELAPPPIPGEPIDLGDGVRGTLYDYGIVVGPLGDMAQYEIQVENDDLYYGVLATGLTKDEIIVAASSLSIGENGEWVLVDDVPADLGEGEEYESPTFQGAHTFVNYVFADGTSAAVEVYAHPEQVVLDDIERAKANPTADEYVIDVRGNDAIVRGGDSTTHTVSWQEDTGELVVVLLTQATGPAVPDVSVVVDGITELDEATFQDLVARYPG
jgi:hypothetical protein